MGILQDGLSAAAAAASRAEETAVDGQDEEESGWVDRDGGLGWIRVGIELDRDWVEWGLGLGWIGIGIGLNVD